MGDDVISWVMMLLFEIRLLLVEIRLLLVEVSIISGNAVFNWCEDGIS